MDSSASPALRASQYLPVACFEALQARLSGVKGSQAVGEIQQEWLKYIREASGEDGDDEGPIADSQDSLPIFVTWEKSEDGGSTYDLRGCIGTFADGLLSEITPEYAIMAAFEDSRFDQISSSETASLSCSVTLLSDFEARQDPLDWEIGTHGVRFTYASGSRNYSATFLPDVAKEQEWSKEQTLFYLVRKSGLDQSGELGGAVSADSVADALRSDRVRFERYQGKKTKVSYGQWKAWRDWLDGKETGRQQQ